MQRIPTANQLSGRAIGSIFFVCFGTGWFFLALPAKQRITSRHRLRRHAGHGVSASGCVQPTCACQSAGRACRTIRPWAAPLAWINAIQWTAVAIVAFSFAKLHIDAYVISAITAIIGLHMFPLARLFRYPIHYATGAVLVAWAAASAMLVPVEQMQGTAALGTGIILWLSAIVTLSIGVKVARQPIPETSVA